MKQCKIMMSKRIALFASGITTAMVLNSFQKYGSFTHTFSNGDCLYIGKDRGTFYGIGTLDYIQVYYGEKDNYGSGVVFMVTRAQYFSPLNPMLAIHCFMQRLHSESPWSYYGTSLSLEDISKMKKPKFIHVIKIGGRDYMNDAFFGFDENNNEYRFLTNFDTHQEELYRKVIQSDPSKAKFGICDEAYGYDEDTGETWELHAHKALYVRHSLRSLDDFWKHFDTVKRRCVMPDFEVLVEFTMSESIWNKVVVEAGPDEKVYVDSEGSDSFVIAYPSHKALDAAINRFDGEVEYRIID